MEHNLEKNKRSLFTQFALIIIFLLLFIKGDCIIYASPLEYKNTNGTESVLLVDGSLRHTFKLYESQNFSNEIKNYTHSCTIFLSINYFFKYSLIYYNNYICLQLKSYNKTFIPESRLISIIQKNNIPHQSSDEDQLQFN